MKLSIIIPCYNEAESIPLVLKSFAGALTRKDVELILVNNGSTDGSAAALKKLAPLYPFLRVLTVSENRGYGFGILRGLYEARGEYLGWTHGDLQTPPEDALRALEIIETKNNPRQIYVKGNRRKRPFSDSAFAFGMTVFEFLHLGRFMPDINAQPNVFHRSFFESWKNPPNDFALDLYAFYQAKKSGVSMIRFDVKFPRRLRGTSHWNTGIYAKWKFIKRTVAFSIGLKKLISSNG